MLPSLNHVALLVRSAESSAAACGHLGFPVGPADDFPSEGTREVYVGPSTSQGLLLLMEATTEGPYLATLKKRGPGLHHIAVDVASVDDYVAELAGSGWLLHPVSLSTWKRRKTVYLARPGLCSLIEVHESREGEHWRTDERFVTEVSIEGAPDHQRLLDALGVPGLRIAAKDAASVMIGGEKLAISKLALS